MATKFIKVSKSELFDESRQETVSSEVEDLKEWNSNVIGKTSLKLGTVSENEIFQLTYNNFVQFF